MLFDRSDKEKLLKAVGSKICLHRNIKAFTIKKLAMKCDMVEKQLSEIEDGKIDVRINTLLKIAFHLDISLKDLQP